MDDGENDDSFAFKRKVDAIWEGPDKRTTDTLVYFSERLRIILNLRQSSLY
jgi:hypothetical protein